MSAQPIRIAMLVRAFPTVSETFIRDQITGLRDAGHLVDIYSLYAGQTAREPPGTTAAGVRYLIGPELPLHKAITRALGRLARGTASPTALLRLTRDALRHPRQAAEAVHALPFLGRRQPCRYDVIHAHFGPTGLLAMLLRQSRLMDGPLVTTFHGTDLTRYRAKGDSKTYSALFRSGDLFTVNSRFTEAMAVAMGAPSGRIHRLPVGVDVEDIEFQPRSRSARELRLLTVGRLEEVKGIGYALRAVALLEEGGVDVRYTVVGGGRLAGALEADATRLGVAPRVHFTGPLPSDQVMREYGQHDLFIMPGIEADDGQVEAQGRVLLEAQASGMPVVASRVGGIPETVAPGAGRLIPPADAEALASAVRALLDSPESWAAMGEHGRRHVRENFNSRKLLTQLIGIYRVAMAGSTDGSSDT